MSLEQNFRFRLVLIHDASLWCGTSYVVRFDKLCQRNQNRESNRSSLETFVNSQTISTAEPHPDDNVSASTGCPCCVLPRYVLRISWSFDISHGLCNSSLLLGNLHSFSVRFRQRGVPTKGRELLSSQYCRRFRKSASSSLKILDLKNC